MANPAIDLNAETPLEDENVYSNPTETLTDPSPPQPAATKTDRLTELPNAATDFSAAKVTGSVDSSAISAPANHIQKKIRRAERFGVPVQLTEEEKRNSRAERFGSKSTLPTSDVSKNAEEQKRKARAERFGLSGPSAAPDDETRKKSRVERFGSTPKTDPAEEAKRNARALRFANPQANSEKLNGNRDAVPKAAVAGKATGDA